MLNKLPFHSWTTKLAVREFFQRMVTAPLGSMVCRMEFSMVVPIDWTRKRLEGKCVLCLSSRHKVERMTHCCTGALSCLWHSCSRIVSSIGLRFSVILAVLLNECHFLAESYVHYHSTHREKSYFRSAFMPKEGIISNGLSQLCSNLAIPKRNYAQCTANQFCRLSPKLWQDE